MVESKHSRETDADQQGSAGIDAPRKIQRFTVKKRCKSWDFLLYIAVKMAGKCDKNATNSRKTCLCDSVRPCSVCFALYHTAV